MPTPEWWGQVVARLTVRREGMLLGGAFRGGIRRRITWLPGLRARTTLAYPALATRILRIVFLGGHLSRSGSVTVLAGEERRSPRDPIHEFRSVMNSASEPTDSFRVRM
jgi:hypothetical protein